MTLNGIQTFGHCDPCAESTVQPYRKAVKPEKCNTCKAYEAGKDRGFQMAADTVHDIFTEIEHPTLGIRKFYAHIIENLLETP